MNKKIAMSGMSILSALVLLGGTAYAAFTTQATATGTTFSAATPNLQIQTTGGLSSSVPGFNVGNLVPGASTAPQAFNLRNDNSGASMPVVLKLTPTLANTMSGADLTIDVVCTGSGIESHSYTDWISTGYQVTNLADNTTVACSMTATLNSGVGNSAAGTQAIFDAVFTGTVGN